MAKMTTSEIQSAVGRMIRTATGGLSDAISTERGDLFDRYMGEPYGDEVDDRSQVVSSDISDTIEWIMPELMEIFTGGDRVVDFEPLGPDDEQKADQEADVVNHVFMRKNPGFLTLYSFFKDALIQKNGYVKRWWEEKDETRVEEYAGLTPDELMMLASNWRDEGAEVDVIEQSEDEDGLSIKARLSMKTEGLRIAPLPPEEVLVSSRWNSIFLDDAPFVAHRRLMTVSDLIAAGYERKQVEALPDAEDEDISEERIDRFDTRGAEEDDRDEAPDGSMRNVLVHECYIRIDYDGDGMAELRKVTVAGSGHEVLRWAEGGEDNEEVASIPISAMTPVIVPHRHYGRSIAELVQDLQRIKTVLMRQMLDNVYLTNNPTREIAERGIGQTTIEDLLVERPGKIVRTREPGHYVEHSPPQFMGQMLPAIEYIDSVRENRTGVTRYNQGLDANSLNKTATGISQIMSAAQKKIALIARIFAETGVRHLFAGIHGDLRRNATKKMTVRLRGEFVPVDPRHWRHRADLAINVALGTGSRDQMVAKLMMIAEKQEQHLLNGSPMVTLAELHHTYSQMVEKSGFKSPDMFFRDPAKIPPAEPKPDPAQQQMQMLMQIEMAKVQAKAQAEAEADKMKDQRERGAMALEHQRELEKLRLEMALKEREMQMKAQMQQAAMSMRPQNDA